MFAVHQLSRHHAADDLVEHDGDAIASVLRGERAPLSHQERDEILRHRLSYLADDLVIPTWNAAFVYDTPAGTQAAVEIVEFANSQLLQFRYYDELLDNALAGIYAKMQKAPRWYDSLVGSHYAKAVRQVHALFIDVNELTDRTENALKIVGDVYAARLFSLVGSAPRSRAVEDERQREAEDARRHLSFFRRTPRHGEGRTARDGRRGDPRLRTRAVLYGNHGLTMNDVLAIILGGGQGSRLFPLTQQRSKPAVPIGGKYRLIDVPISNCLHADLRRIFVLTQFNSASLNHHVAQSYHMDPFSRGFVDIIAAEQTPDNSNWFQGTADAVRQAARHFCRYEADYYLILAGDHLYRMDYGLLLESHVDQDADITVAALPVTPEDAPGHGLVPVRPRGTDRRLRGEADQRTAGCARQQRAAGQSVLQPDTPAGETVHRLDGHLRVLARGAAGPAAATRR